LKSWLFQASIRNCLNFVHNCDDHSLLGIRGMPSVSSLPYLSFPMRKFKKPIST